MTIEELSALAESARNEIEKAVVGQPRVVRDTLAAVLAGGHVLLEGVPGTAKTLLARTLARVLGGEFKRIQFTPDLMPSDITGGRVFNLRNNEFETRRGPVFCDVLLADEINRTSAKTQAALLEAMQERKVSIDGETHALSPTFTVIATQNPVESEGTYPLPEAQRDRFLLQVQVGYPSLEDEERMLERFGPLAGEGDLEVLGVAALLDAAGLREARAIVTSVECRPEVRRYALALIDTSRRDPALLFGASPRATLHLLQAAKALAVLSGRGFVTPDDVREMAAPALRHRLILRAEAEIEGSTPDEVIGRIAESVEIPR
jgi:MoxR-like ATPase